MTKRMAWVGLMVIAVTGFAQPAADAAALDACVRYECQNDNGCDFGCKCRWVVSELAPGECGSA
ncbi:MAG: hypothetical protein IPK85_04475 [Gemmatimonadetes bacterium]|nr:hypothetical protein [Gemmatimonadota bacterium]